MSYSLQDRTGAEIAIVGMAGRFPGADNVDAFWRNLQAGLESVTRFDAEELRRQGVDAALLDDPNYVKAGVLLEGLDRFDAGFFGYSPREAQQFDPQHRLFLETAWEALEHAGYGEPATNPLTGIYAGCGANLYLMRHLLPSLDWRGGDISALLGLMNGNDQDSLVSRVAFKFDLRGPSLAVQTACSTSLAAVHLACRGLLNHEADLALAGGVWLNLLQQGGYLHQPGAILSPDGHCRAFDERAAGTLIGSGVGVVVLKRLDEALADGDTIHAVIKGSALNNDGAAKVGFAAPSVDGQTEVIVAAHSMAQVPSDAIGYVEAHGTGTTLGDPIEVAALTQAFRRGSERRGYCALGSLKTNVGHLDAAAGVAGLIKAASAVRDGVLPPSLNFERPNPQIDFAGSPFYVNTQSKPWPKGARYAGVSSFGMGGTNVHVVLEQAPPMELVVAEDIGLQVLQLSARSSASLAAARRRLSERLGEESPPGLTDIAYTLRAGRRHFEHRAALIARDLSEARTALDGASANELFEGRVLSEQPTVAFLFPGQGAQHPDMGRALYEREPVFRAAVDEACDKLCEPLGLDLRSLLFPAASNAVEAAERLQQTALTQPALFVIEHAMAKLWMRWGLAPDAMLGHSIGEYVAACVAGVFDLDAALAIVALRGKLLQATEPGAMLAVSLSEAELAAFELAGCDLAAVNADALCVLAGSTDAIAAAQVLIEARGAAVRRLHVSHAFHSVLVEPMLAEFEQHLARVRLSAPRIPFVSNVTGRWITPEEACSPAYWVKHLRGTVRFAAGLSELLAKPDRALLEVGPGETLSGLARRHPLAGSARPIVASQCHPQRAALNADQPARCIARLWVAGVAVDRYPHSPGRRVPLPTYPFERQSYWIEAPSAARGARAAAPLAPVSLKRRLPIDAWFHQPVWKRVPLPRHVQRPACAGAVLLLGPAEGVCAALRVELAARGLKVVHAAASSSKDEVEVLLREVEREHGTLAAICHLGSLNRGTPPPEAMQERGLHSLIALAQALDAVSVSAVQPLTITVVSDGLEDVTGAEVLRPEKATLHGPCKVIPQEYPQLACRLIDIVAPAARSDAERALARQIALEIEGGTGVELVAYRGAHRWIRDYEPLLGHPGNDSGGDVPLRKHGVYLITGGLGGIGLAFARHLALNWQARLVLVGRGAPDDAQRAELSAFEAAGAEVLALQADVADERGLRETLAVARAHFGAIDGAIHAAGVAGGGRIAQRDRAAIERVLAPKLDGTLNLLDALGDDAADFVLLCSSLTAATGGFGQVDYCAANCALEAIAQRAARDGRRRAIAVAWDAWRDVGMAASQRLPDGFGIDPAEAGELLERVLAVAPSAQLVVSTIDLEQQFAQSASTLDASELLADPIAPRARHPRPALPTPYAAPQSELEEGLAALWGEFLGIDSIGAEDHFFELGGDSLLAIQLVARLRSLYGVQLHPAEFFKTPTIAALAATVELRLIEAIEHEEAAKGAAV
ncbi:SDR family NAD(P)-dependent oxidoreductase [Roseateles sp. BYS180W]|uniref:SDR family NAD(P)-dependent oxidoreductase n=1 Tax=Roseateles rivi TaxID=3299028 RepID=A0ABW7FXQ4_9BURK